MKHILIVEDEKNLADILQLNFEQLNYLVSIVNDGQQGLQSILNNYYDAVILDIMLPYKDGFDILKEVRLAGITTPILILSARAITSDKILGLKLGANDYLAKPFEFEELILRLEKMLPKQIAATQNHEKWTKFTLNNQIFDTSKNIIINKLTTFTSNVTYNESQLLLYFFKHEDEMLERSNIIQHIWGKNAFLTARTIDNMILNLRKIFENDFKKPVYFLTIRGLGYKFTSNGTLIKET
ncbi:MAG: response regulator transcription factor [Sediminibacterium sp.]|nr:response regulator transcription factor [Sediminibacterium sp.]